MKKAERPLRVFQKWFWSIETSSRTQSKFEEAEILSHRCAETLMAFDLSTNPMDFCLFDNSPMFAMIEKLRQCLNTPE
jgi:hypothetical protein